MGKIRTPHTVTLFSGIIAADEACLRDAVAALAAVWGPVADHSAVMPLSFTNYYGPEMGAGLLRQWVAFDGVRAQDELAALKRQSIDIEQHFAVGGRRRVNIDPGYVTPAKVVLASTKDYSHRIYLAHSIYAEVTMMFQKGKYVFLPWTYFDYRSEIALEFFLRIRKPHTIL